MAEFKTGDAVRFNMDVLECSLYDDSARFEGICMTNREFPETEVTGIEILSGETYYNVASVDWQSFKASELVLVRRQ